MYKVVLSRQAAKDRASLKAAKLEDKARALLLLLSEDPYRDPPPFETLKGNLKGYYSRRINYKHRLVYEVLEEQKTVHVLRMWTHYER